MSAYTHSLLEPLVQALARTEERARKVMHEAGRLQTELDAARARIAVLEAAQSPSHASGAAESQDVPPATA
jgi:hypothetical protein